MAKQKGHQELAKEFLDLWQRQVGLWLREPDLASGAMLQVLQAAQEMQNTLSPDDAAPGYGYAGSGEENCNAAADKRSHTSASLRSDDKLLKLERRMDECEQRLFALERGAGGRRKKASARTRKSSKS